MPSLSFKPKNVTKKITSHLADRASDVIMNRFGLGSFGERKTLEEIGKKYNITRERVRQVEDAAMTLIKKSEHYKNEQASFDELKQLVRSLGSIVAEHELLRKLYASLSDEDLVPETEMIKKFFDQMKDVSEQYRNEEMARRWLSMSKTVAKNPLGEWGKSSSPNIRT